MILIEVLLSFSMHFLGLHLLKGKSVPHLTYTFILEQLAGSDLKRNIVTALFCSSVHDITFIVCDIRALAALYA